MRLPWLRHDRVEILSALALIAGEGDDLLTGLERLAADDPSLQRWLPRLAPLRSGADIVVVLRRLRLVDDAEATWLDACREAGSFGAGLRIISESSGQPYPRLVFVRWYPLIVLMVITGLPVALLWALDWTGTNTLRQIYDELGLRVSMWTELVVMTEWWQQLIMLGSVYLVIGLAVWLCWRHWLLRFLLVPWAVDVYREALIYRLVHVAACEAWRADLRPADEEPPWSRDWSMLWVLSGALRKIIGHDPVEHSLPERLSAAGILVEKKGYPDWEATLEQAKLHLQLAQNRCYPVLIWFMFALGCVMAFHAYFGPLLEIINKLG